MAKALMSVYASAGAALGVSAKNFKTDTHTYTTKIVNSGGGITALTTGLEGSIDGVSWFYLDTHIWSAGDLTALFVAVNIATKMLVNYVKGSVVSATGTGTVTMTYEGSSTNE